MMFNIRSLRNLMAQKLRSYARAEVDRQAKAGHKN
jgi:hypothetical protein